MTSQINSIFRVLPRQLLASCALRVHGCESKRPLSITSSNRTSQTVDQEELAKFNNAARSWWNSTSPLAHPALHSLNYLRVPLIRNALEATSSSRPSYVESPARPLSGLRILDVGCGGGILSEPLARLGAEVTGLDASSELIKAAEWHAGRDPDLRGRVKYICSTIEDVSSDPSVEQFDAVVASEVIEHVINQSDFVSCCCKLVKPGGSLFFTTINRTFMSYALGIVAAEYIFGVLPRGTHDWYKFISPQEIQSLLAPNFTVRLINGVALNPLTKRWFLTSSTDVSYMFHAVHHASETFSDKNNAGNVGNA